VEVRAFAERLRAATGLAVHFVEESFSSRDAQRVLRNRKRSSRRDKASVDRVSACLILDQFLKEYSEIE
jgi:putative transcription antitermination factor YqgF